jgi:hypothetical protein
MFAASQVTVPATVGGIIILSGGDVLGAQVAVGRGQVGIRNMDAAKTLWLGGINVDATTHGFDVLPGETFFADDLGAGDAIYGITSAGTITVKVFYQE